MCTYEASIELNVTICNRYDTTTCTASEPSAQHHTTISLHISHTLIGSTARPRAHAARTGRRACVWNEKHCYAFCMVRLAWLFEHPFKMHLISVLFVCVERAKIGPGTALPRCCRCSKGASRHTMFISFSECFRFTVDGFVLLYYGRAVIIASDGDGNQRRRMRVEQMTRRPSKPIHFTLAIRLASHRKSRLHSPWQHTRRYRAAVDFCIFNLNAIRSFRMVCASRCLS